MKSSKIFCIGDSHVSVFLGRDELAPLLPSRAKSFFKNIEVIRLEGILAYNLCEYNRTTLGREKLEKELEAIPLGSYILISAGEVDCRVHLIKQAENNNSSYQAVAELLTDRYVGYLKTLKSNYKICILLPPPSSYLDENQIDIQYPRYGNELERNKLTKILNATLIKKCAEYGIITIGVSNTTDALGNTIKKLLWDGIHYSTYALPELIDQINLQTEVKVHIPIKWWIKEFLRRVKNFNIKNK